MSKKKLQFDVNPLFRGPSLVDRARAGNPYREVPLSEIDIDPDQPRRVFEDNSLQELSASIREHGVLCPILVRIKGAGTFRLIAGERRFRAAKLAGLSTIPAVIHSGDETTVDVLSKQLVENLQRADLSAMERALAIGQLRDALAISVRDIAQKLGVSKSYVQRSLDILSLPDDLQAALIQGAPESKITILGRLADKAQRAKLLEELDELTREELEFEVAKLLGEVEEKVSHRGTKGKRKSKGHGSSEDRRIVEGIQESLGSRARIVRSSPSSEKGKVVLEFYSKDDLNEIYKRLTR